MVWSRRKENWYVQTVLPWEKGELFTRESKRHCRQHVWPSSGGPKMRFVKHQHQCFWPSSGLSFFSWSSFDASQLPAYTTCFRLLKKHSTGRSWGTFGGSEVFKPSRLLCSWRNFEHLLPLFQDWGGYMGLLPLAECHAFLPEGLSVGNS